MPAWLFPLFRFAGALWLLVACHSAIAIQIIESGVEAGDQTQIFWISSDEVLFYGPSGEHVARPDGSRKRVHRLTTWNARTKETKRFGEVDANLCYDSGNIAYSEIDHAAAKGWTSIGRFPGEIKRSEGPIRFDSLSCLPLDALPPLPDWTRERSIMRLRPEHGFLDLGPQKEPKNTPVRLLRNSADKAIEVPIRRREFSQAWVHYYPHKGAYFLPGDFFRPDPRHPYGGYNQSPWPEAKPRPVRWLYPDGSVEEVFIPPARWTTGTLVPTKAGVVALDSTFFTVTGDAPTDGVYLLNEKGWARRVSRGLFENHALSDDGCRLAVVRQPEPGKRRPIYWTVTIYDVCARR